MTSAPTLTDARFDDGDAVRGLLADAGLPTADLPAELVGFDVARDGAQVVGCAGLERAGESGLLRSVAVAFTRRNQGLGRALVERCLARARGLGLRDVYLLTTTAETYFAGLGFEAFPRERAPAGIRATAELTSLCPSTAILMRKAL